MIRLHRASTATTIAAAAAVMLVLGASPAAADPAEPSNYESTVVSVDPLPSGVSFEVVGGDSFLVATAEPGHEVLVLGYFSEPYLRIDADGSVWLNENSRAFYINIDRYANAEVPDWVDDEGPPRWKQVDDSGAYPWHDHRVHWMSPDPPPTIDGSTREVVFPWELPVIVDGRESVIRGELVWVPSLSPIGPLLAGIIALLPLVAWRRWRTPLAGALTGGGALLAIVVTVIQSSGTPAAARGFPIWIVFPAVALATTIAALIAWRTDRATLANRLNVTSGVVLVAWAVATLEVLWLPVLPSAASPDAERVAVAFVLWAGIGAAAFSAVTLLRPARR